MEVSPPAFKATKKKISKKFQKELSQLTLFDSSILELTSSKNFKDLKQRRGGHPTSQTLKNLN